MSPQWHATCTASDYAIGLGGQDGCDVELCVPGKKPPGLEEGEKSGFCVKDALSRDCHDEYGVLVGVTISHELKRETIELFGQARAPRIAPGRAESVEAYDRVAAFQGGGGTRQRHGSERRASA